MNAQAEVRISQRRKAYENVSLQNGLKSNKPKNAQQQMI